MNTSIDSEISYLDEEFHTSVTRKVFKAFCIPQLILHTYISVINNVQDKMTD